MAQNDPGWGGRNNDGPPDLDEMMRQFSRKLNNLFGKRGPSGQPQPSSSGQSMPIGPIIGLVALIWLGSGFYIVDEGSRGLVLRFGKHVETTMPGPRWHFPYPVETATIVNMEQVRTLEVGYRSGVEGGPMRSKELRESLMLTDDENIIDLQFAVQYNLKAVDHYLFNNRSVDDAVRGTAERLLCAYAPYDGARAGNGATVDIKGLLKGITTPAAMVPKPKNELRSAQSVPWWYSLPYDDKMLFDYPVTRSDRLLQQSNDVTSILMRITAWSNKYGYVPAATTNALEISRKQILQIMNEMPLIRTNYY